MNEILQKAIDSLKINDVYLRSSTEMLSDDFEPKYELDLVLDVQYMHQVLRSNVLILGNEEGESSTQFFRVFVELGARWVASSDERKDSDDCVKAKVEALMVAEYRMHGDPGEVALKEFAMKNASYHIWPYWREYLASQCMRMNLPKLVLPTVQFANNKEVE